MTRFLVSEVEEGVLGITLTPHEVGGYVQTHKDLWVRLASAVPGAKFVGAGYYYPRRAPEFDSGTCKQFFGFDRPEDKNLQKQILDEILAFARQK